MYTPSSFAETDLAVLYDFVEQHSFGVLVSHVDGNLFATHLPFLLERNAGPDGSLLTHVARANPQWREISGQTALTIFNGPHTYISPTWYGEENLVPTWNYQVVHISSHVTLIEQDESVLDILQKTVSFYERTMPEPWSFEPKSKLIKQLLPQIVGLRLEITKIEGKFKLNQNHPIERRQRVVSQLQTRASDNALAIAAAMKLPIHKQ